MKSERNVFSGVQNVLCYVKQWFC